MLQLRLQSFVFLLQGGPRQSKIFKTGGPASKPGSPAPNKPGQPAGNRKPRQLAGGNNKPGEPANKAGQQP
eukprot:2000540-Amphidinium_carterae.1